MIGEQRKRVLLLIPSPNPSMIKSWNWGCLQERSINIPFPIVYLLRLLCQWAYLRMTKTSQEEKRDSIGPICNLTDSWGRYVGVSHETVFQDSSQERPWRVPLAMWAEATKEVTLELSPTLWGTMVKNLRIWCENLIPGPYMRGRIWMVAI